MIINYQDKGTVVTYIQIFLKDYFGLFIDKTSPKKKNKSEEYYVSSNKTIKVTGYHNTQTYSSIALYMFYNYPEEGYPYLWKETSPGLWTREDSPTESTVVDIISSNISNLPRCKQAIEIPERVISYVLGEVVSESSSPEEILRIKKMIYGDDKIGVVDSLEYTEELSLKVKEIQQRFKDKYTVNGVTTYPEEFEGFRVTGYVDPWTEIVIKGGVE